MAGIYLHIPFCRKACTYCDFHFSTNTKGKKEVLNAMQQELEVRAVELHNQTIDTIYFGGGTPSLIAMEDLASLLRTMRERFTIGTDPEITLEANPDDITEERLAAWKSAGITRISLGTQSFREERLHFMGRAHSPVDALRSIDLIAKAGFASWTIDLIYGLPQMSLDEWDEQLTIALDHGMPHLSAYCLTVEPRTVLAHQVKQGLITEADDADQSAQFDRLMERMEVAGLEHYEISNFGRPGHFSRHNTSYWNGVHYLGIGPSAHSFDGRTRRWNVRSNAAYTKALGTGGSYWESETLSAADRTNERLMTGLRTQWGVDLAALEHDILQLHSSAVQGHVSKGHLQVRDGRLVLSKAGRHFADRIAADLFVVAHDR
jgi:oxygen-independent coproporphyrinogen-3 oxidase